METLLEKALSIKSGNRSKMAYTKEEIELSAAYCNGKVSMAQVAEVIGKKESGNILYFIGSAIKCGIRDGHITLEYRG